MVCRVVEVDVLLVEGFVGVVGSGKERGLGLYGVLDWILDFGFLAVAFLWIEQCEIGVVVWKCRVCGVGKWFGGLSIVCCLLPDELRAAL